MGFFSKKKKDADANPYAQDGAQVPFANPLTPYQQARNNLAQGQPVGLSTGSHMNPGSSNTPPPSYHSPSIASSRFGDEKYGSQNGYGADRYGNSRSSPAGSRAPGGYGGFDVDAGKNDLLGGASGRAGAAQQSNIKMPPTGDNRNPALFGNAQDRYNPYNTSQTQSQSGPDGDEYGGYGAPREMTEEEREEQEIQDLKNQIKAVKQEDVKSLQRTIQTGRQGLDQILTTRVRIAEQEERLQDTERKLDLATIHAKDGTDKTKLLDKLNGTPFFVPVAPGKKARAREVEATMERHREEREIREQTRRDGFAAQQRMEETTKQLLRDQPERKQLGGKRKTNDKFRFEEPDEEEEQLDQETEDNLDEVADILGKINSAANLVGEDIQQSIHRLNRIGEKTDLVDDNVRKNRAMLNHIR